jgi:hypothetical protein
VELRKLILFIHPTFPANKSWRFIPASFVFPNPLDPWETPFPESIEVEDFFMERLDINFIGIKIGDVNGNASPSPFSENETDRQ